MTDAPHTSLHKDEDTGEIDPVVGEVRRVRERYAASFNYDIRRMAADLREREQQHLERLVTFPPRRFTEVIAES